ARHLARAGDGLAEERLAGAGWTLEEDAVWWVRAHTAEVQEPLEEVDDLLGGVDDGGLAPHVVEGDVVLPGMDDVGAPAAHVPEQAHELQDQEPHVEEHEEDERHRRADERGEQLAEVADRLEGRVAELGLDELAGELV